MLPLCHYKATTIAAHVKVAKKNQGCLSKYPDNDLPNDSLPGTESNQCSEVNPRCQKFGIQNLQ